MLRIQFVEEGISLLVKFKRLFRINLLIIKLEYVILESDMNVFLCRKIYWSLSCTKAFTWMCIV